MAMTSRYKVLTVTKGAHIHECQQCGALVYHRSVHDAWHALYDLMVDIALTVPADTDPDLD